MNESGAVFSLVRSRKRLSVLADLAEGRRIPSQITEATGMHKTQVSRAMRELLGAGLVECENPAERNFRFYHLTPKGKRILAKAQKIVAEIGAPKRVP